MVSRKHKKVFKVSNYTEHFPFLVSAIIGCALISAFASLICIPIGITTYVVGLKICAITAGIKKYKSVIMKIKEP